MYIVTILSQQASKRKSFAARTGAELESGKLTIQKNRLIFTRSPCGTIRSAIKENCRGTGIITHVIRLPVRGENDAFESKKKEKLRRICFKRDAFAGDLRMIQN